VSNLYHFHVNLLAAPPTTFALSWEEVAAKLERLPRMIFELDGSFVVSGDQPQAGPCPTAMKRWQVDGHLFDFDGRLRRVELHGHCPPDDFDNLLRCVDWPEQPLAFEMVREGATLDESAFRRHVGATRNST
jgi:hypothetical protein